jgi:hypothetical protein
MGTWRIALQSHRHKCGVGNKSDRITNRGTVRRNGLGRGVRRSQPSAHDAVVQSVIRSHPGYGCPRYPACGYDSGFEFRTVFATDWGYGRSTGFRWLVHDKVPEIERWPSSQAFINGSMCLGRTATTKAAEGCV